MPNNLFADGFHHVAIRVRDFDASLKFYTELLGFEIKHLWGEGDSRGVLIDTGRSNYFELFAGGSAEQQPQGLWFHIALLCSDTEGALERVRSAGIPITVETKDVTVKSDPPLPIRVAFFSGPDGESIELFELR